MKFRRSPEPLAALLPKLLDPLAAQRGLSQSALILNWREIVGERIANACEPLFLRWPPRGPKSAPQKKAEPAVLTLRVDPGFGLQIQHLEPVLLEKVNAFLGWRCVGRILLRQEPAEKPLPSHATSFSIRPEAQKAAEDLAGGIEDEKLRAALIKLGAAVFSQEAAVK